MIIFNYHYHDDLVKLTTTSSVARQYLECDRHHLPNLATMLLLYIYSLRQLPSKLQITNLMLLQVAFFGQHWKKDMLRQYILHNNILIVIYVGKPQPKKNHVNLGIAQKGGGGGSKGLPKLFVAVNINHY